MVEVRKDNIPLSQMGASVVASPSLDCKSVVQCQQEYVAVNVCEKKTCVWWQDAKRGSSEAVTVGNSYINMFFALVAMSLDTVYMGVFEYMHLMHFKKLRTEIRNYRWSYNQTMKTFP